MIKYRFFQKNAASHYVYIHLLIDNITGDKIRLQLPAWRPGRYELGNFAKNIKRVDAFDEHQQVLKHTKLNKDLWEIETGGARQVKVTYSYYAAELNAGACYADDSQVYINPVHCCMYVVGRTNEPHVLQLEIPDNYKIASSLRQSGNELQAMDYEELADSPFIASATIKSGFYEVNGIKFHLHFNGECKPDFNKITRDFMAFTTHCIHFWNDFPYDSYHFLFQVVPHKFYHGVEHKKNTVIAIGPGYAINSGAAYEDVVGVSCHELFHVWNVKTIRPFEMQPYDFTRENYARTGYVYEGFTTYYGDKLLLGSGVFTLQQYFATLQERLQKHFHNFGRFNLSVAHSSWETWLDGYVPGAPYRKTNIYDEGSLIAFMLDVKILEATDNKMNLRNVCLLLYERFGKSGKGYKETDIITLVNEVSGKDFSDFFGQYVYTASDFGQPLNACFAYLGLEMVKRPSESVAENLFGFKSTDNGLLSRVTVVAPYSPAWKAGLFTGDDIVAVNKMAVKNNLNSWLHYFSDGQITLTVNSGDQLKEMILQRDEKGTTYFFDPYLMQRAEDKQAAINFKAWAKF
jgi:predicted metalloprotease with PDZ domain